MNLSQSIIITFSTRILTVILAIITQIIIARMLGPAGKGMYSLIILVPTLLINLGNLGIGISNTYFIGKKKYELNSVASNSLISAISFGILFAGLFFCFFPWLKDTVLKDVNSLYLRVAVLSLPFAFLILYFEFILLGQGRIKEYNLVPLIRSTSLVVLIFLFLIIFKKGIGYAVSSWVFATIIASILAFILVTQTAKIKFSLNTKLFKESIAFGIKGYLANVIALLNYRLDMFLVNFFMNVKFVGYYSVAVFLAETLWYFPGAVGTVIFPKVASLSKDASDKLTPQVCRITLFFTLIFSILLFILSKVIIYVFFGSRFLPALKPLWMLLPGIVMLSIPKVLSNDLTGRGYPIINTYAAGVGLVTNAFLNLIFIPKWGISGAAFASTIAYTVITIVVLAAFKKITKNKIIDTLIMKKTDFQILVNKLKMFLVK